MDAYGNGGSRFDLAHARLAQADAKRSAELDAQLARIGIRGNGAERYCSDCGQQLSRRCLGEMCKKCGNKHAERARRQKAARAKLAAKGINL